MSSLDVEQGRADRGPQDTADTAFLAVGGLGAALASACCILPFILVVFGLGGAWLGTLHALYPYRWIFIGSGVAALYFAWRRLYRPQSDCAEGEACAVPVVMRTYRVAFWVVAGLVALSAAAPYLLGAVVS